MSLYLEGMLYVAMMEYSSCQEVMSYGEWMSWLAQMMQFYASYLLFGDFTQNYVVDAKIVRESWQPKT